MSDTQNAVDTATQPVAGSTPVAPPNPAGDTQGSTPASEVTSATPAQDEGETPEAKQSRRESRAYATQRRENRDLHRQIGRLEQMIAGLRPQSAPAEGEQPEQRQTHTPAEAAAARREAAATRLVLDRLEEAGEEIEGFDKVMETITGDFPITTVMRDFLGESDKPAEMAKWLSENRREAERISLLSDAVAVRALEKAESRLKGAAKPPPKNSTAPPPVPTVGGRSAPSFDPNKASMDEYAAEWKRRQAAK